MENISCTDKTISIKIITEKIGEDRRCIMHSISEAEKRLVWTHVEQKQSLEVCR